MFKLSVIHGFIWLGTHSLTPVDGSVLPQQIIWCKAYHLPRGASWKTLWRAKCSLYHFVPKKTSLPHCLENCCHMTKIHLCIAILLDMHLLWQKMLIFWLCGKCIHNHNRRTENAWTPAYITQPNTWASQF